MANRAALLTVALSMTLSLAVSVSASAQSLKLDFHDGLVTLEATSVPVRTILTEWGKRGGTKILGADRLAGAPLTVKLTNVSETKALDIVLRNAAGYMAAPRVAGTGPSMYDRILIMATTSAPPPTAARTPLTPNPAMAGTQRFVPPRPQQPRADQDQDVPEEPDDNPPNPPVFTFPQQGQAQPGIFTGAPPQLNGQPVSVTVNPQTGAPQTITINPSQPATTPTGATGASTPGVIIQPAAPAQPTQPGSLIRPPGNQ